MPRPHVLEDCIRSAHADPKTQMPPRRGEGTAPDLQPLAEWSISRGQLRPCVSGKGGPNGLRFPDRFFLGNVLSVDTHIHDERNSKLSQLSK